MTHTISKATAPHDRVKIEQARKDVQSRNEAESKRAATRRMRQENLRAGYVYGED